MKRKGTRLIEDDVNKHGDLYERFVVSAASFGNRSAGSAKTRLVQNIQFHSSDVPTIVGTVLKFALLLACAVFLLHLIGRVKTFLTSVKESSRSKRNENDSTFSEAIKQVRQTAQASYDEQAAEFRESVTLPREEEDRRKREEEFYRFTKRHWTTPGQMLGGSKTLAESSLRMRSSPSEPSQDPENDDSTAKAKETNPMNIPDEPGPDALNSVTIILKTPLGTKYKRRFLVTDRVEMLLNYMATVGYHPKLYALCFSYPRQQISDNPMATLEELGIVQDVLLNVEEKD